MNKNGFTLVELMVAVAIAGIVIVALSSVYVSQRRSATAQDQVAEMQQGVRAGLDIMTHEIRMAGYDPRHTAGTGITAATVNNLAFSMVADTDMQDNDADAVIDEADEIETVIYTIYDAYTATDTDALDLGRNVSLLGLPATNQPVAENIDAIEFYYTLADGTQTTAPTAAQLADIRAVQVSLLARANWPDPDFFNNDSYTPASGNTWDLNGANAGNAPNDNFRRRLFITTIQCRNMGL